MYLFALVCFKDFQKWGGAKKSTGIECLQLNSVPLPLIMLYIFQVIVLQVSWIKKGYILVYNDTDMYSKD